MTDLISLIEIKPPITKNDLTVILHQQIQTDQPQCQSFLAELL